MADRSSNAKLAPAPPPVPARKALASEIRERGPTPVKPAKPVATRPAQAKAPPPAKSATKPVPVAKQPAPVAAKPAPIEAKPTQPAPVAAKPAPVAAKPALSAAPLVSQERVQPLPPPLPDDSMAPMRLTPPPLPAFPPGSMSRPATPALRPTFSRNEMPDFLDGAARRKRIAMGFLAVAGLALIATFFAAFLSQLQPR